MVVPNQTRLPIGFSPGQNRRAPVSLTTATGGPSRAIRGRQAAPRTQRDAERSKIVGRHVVTSHGRRGGRLRRLVGKEDDRARAAHERCGPVDRGRLDAGRPLDAREHAFHDRRSIGRGVTRVRRPDPERQHALGVESSAHALHVREGLHEQSGCRQQQHRERHLADHQPRQRPHAAAAAIVFLQRRDEVRPRGVDRRHQREQQRGAERGRHSEQQHARVERRRGERRRPHRSCC